MVTFPNPLGFACTTKPYSRVLHTHPARPKLHRIFTRTCRLLHGSLTQACRILRMRNNKTENLFLTLAGLEEVWISPAKSLSRGQASPPRIAVCASLLIRFTMSKNVGTSPKKKRHFQAHQFGARPNMAPGNAVFST